MKSCMRVAIAPLAIVVLLAACGKNDQATPESRQVELTPAPAAQPQLADTAVTAAPEAELATTAQPTATPTPKPAPKPAPRPAPAPAAAAPTVAATPAPTAPTTGVVAGGSSLGTTLGARVCTNTHKVGDRVTATLASSVPATNGASIPAGATVTLRITESQRGENGKEGIRLAFEPVSVTFDGATYAIEGSATASTVASVRSQTTGDQTKKVATGAVVGAIAGQLLGKRAKTAAIGAAVGAAAGGVVAAGAADWNGCVADGGMVTVTLAGPLTVKIVAGRPGI